LSLACDTNSILHRRLLYSYTHHDFLRSPQLSWGIKIFIYIRTDPAGNIKPDKEKSTEKIDGAVATVMALDRAIRCGNDTSASVYDDRGILFI